MDDILERLQPVFRDIFDDPTLVITRNSSGQTIDGWDSFAHINLVWAIEKEFRIRFALGELQELKNVGDMIDLMQRMMKR